MKANIIDFRTSSSRIIQALDRHENVELFYHGKLKAIIKPIEKASLRKVETSDFFGYLKEDKELVEDKINNLRRKSRYDF